MIAPETAGPASRFGNEMSATGWRITADEYDRKARELTERQTEIALRIEQHQKGSKRAPIRARNVGSNPLGIPENLPDQPRASFWNEGRVCSRLSA